MSDGRCYSCVWIGNEDRCNECLTMNINPKKLQISNYSMNESINWDIDIKLDKEIGYMTLGCAMNLDEVSLIRNKAKSKKLTVGEYIRIILRNHLETF